MTSVDLPDLNESTLGLEHEEVIREGHLLARDGAHNEVQGASVLLGPVLVVVGGNVLVGAELEHLVPLLGLAGDSNDLVSAEGLGEQDTKVSQATDSDNTDGLARSAAVLVQRREDGDTTTEHGRGIGRADALGNGDDKVAVGAVVVGVATVRLALVVGVDGAVCVDGAVAAVVLETGATVDAVGLQARASLGTDTDAVASLDVLHVAANTDGLADNLVADTACWERMSVRAFGMVGGSRNLR